MVSNYRYLTVLADVCAPEQHYINLILEEKIDRNRQYINNPLYRVVLCA